MKKTIRYKGKLAKPMLLKSVVSEYPNSLWHSVKGPDPKEEAEWRAEWMTEWLHNWVALCEHYGLDPKDELPPSKLAMALASDHVPGLTTIFERPRKNLKWDELARLALWFAAAKMRRECNSDEAACEAIYRNYEMRGRLPYVAQPRTYFEQLARMKKNPPKAAQALTKIFDGSGEDVVELGCELWLFRRPLTDC